MTHDGYREAFLVAFDGLVDKLKEATTLLEVDKCLGDLWRLVVAPECLDPDQRENCIQTVNVCLTDALVRIHNAREAPQSQAA